MAVEHALIGVRLADVGRPIAVCSCGAMASGVRGTTWNVRENGDGTVTISSSFNWAGHFHTSNPFTARIIK